MMLIELIIFTYFIVTGAINSANNLWYEKDEEKRTYVLVMGFLTGWYIFPKNFIKGLIKDLKGGKNNYNKRKEN